MEDYSPFLKVLTREDGETWHLFYVAGLAFNKIENNGSRSQFMFNYTKICQTGFQSSQIILHSQQKSRNSSFSKSFFL